MEIKKLSLVVVFTVEMQGETLTSPSEDFDAEQAEEIEVRRATNPWAWCCTRVIAIANDGDGHIYRGESGWLGGCSYASEKDFTRPGCYYDDMKREAFKAVIKKIGAGYDLRARDEEV